MGSSFAAAAGGVERCRPPGPPRHHARRIVRLRGAAALLMLAAAPYAPVASRAGSAPSLDEPTPAAVKVPSVAMIVVRARDTGEPLEGARVRTRRFPHWEGAGVRTGWFPREEVQTTDREGRVRVDLSSRGPLESFSFDVWGDGYVLQEHRYSGTDPRFPEILGSLDILLLPGNEPIGGRVVNVEGRPVAGARVEICGNVAKQDPNEATIARVETMTDAEGRWRCGSFRTMSFAEVTLSHPDFLADGPWSTRRYGKIRVWGRDPRETRSMAGLWDFSDVQVLVRGAELAGTVRDEAGRPVAEAEVGWFPWTSGGVPRHDLPTTTTDAQGRFRFRHATPGRLVVQATAPGHAPGLTWAEPGFDPVRLRLRRPRVLAGRVRDARGRPVAGVHLDVTAWRQTAALGVSFRTDAEGRFRWDDAPDDAVLLRAVAGGFDMVDRHRAVPGEGEVELTLHRTLVVFGQVRDARTSRPVEAATVEVGVTDPETGATVWARDDRIEIDRGRFVGRLDDRRAPDYRLRFRAEGYEPFESEALRVEAKPLKYDAKLTPDEPGGVPR